jgi:hypothetical protein
MPGITITAGTEVSSFSVIQTGRQTQHVLHSCQGLRLLITFCEKKLLGGGMELTRQLANLSPQFAGHRWGINLSWHQLASNEDFGGLRRGAQVGDFIPA